MPMPLEIQGLNKDQVTFVWSEEKSDVWPARVLRLRCTCAYCKSEDTGARLIVDDDIPMDITVTDMHLMGNYGVGIQFSDGHSTGIYRFATLESTSDDSPDES
jgi:ATP-binding protein involved in chromosome partitioning